MGSVLQKLPLVDLVDHEANPRVIMREDVIDGIAANLGEEYPQQHALHVRPFDGKYQIISGHHRKRAAEKKGLQEVWCWVEELDDQAAYMALATSNNQGELSPLEIGLHALHCVALGEKGRGKKGGLTAYAESIGQKQQNVSMYRQAAAVIDSVKPHNVMWFFLDKTFHLAAIHKLPRDCWHAACDWLQKQESVSVADVRKRVDAVVDCLDTVSQSSVASELFGVGAIVDRVLNSSEFGSGTVRALVTTAEAFEAQLQHVAETAEALQPACDAARATFATYCSDDDAAFRPRSLEAAAAELRAGLVSVDQSQWFCGDWRQHIDQLPDNQVALVLIDPPYGMDWQSNRKKDKSQAIANDSNIETACVELAEAIAGLRPKLADDVHLLIFCRHDSVGAFQNVLKNSGVTCKGLCVWVKNNHGTGDIRGAFLPKHELILHGVIGKPRIQKATPDVLHAARVSSDNHPTEKPVDLLEDLIAATTVQGQLVVDLFAGVGSTCVAAEKQKRAWFGCEIDQTYFDIGKRRLGCDD